MTKNDVTAKTIASTLKAHKNILILSHSSPDGDTLGSAFALAHALKSMGKTVQCKCADELPRDFSWLKHSREEFCEEIQPDCIVTVDIADTKLLGNFEAEYSDVIDINIDHHPSNHNFAKINYVVSDACATCEIVFGIIEALNVPLSADMGTALYTGIATDSGCFKYASCTAKTHRVAAACIDAGAAYANINQALFDTRTKQRVAIETLAMQLIEYYLDDRCAIIPITLEMRELTGAVDDDLHGITGLPRQIEGVQVGIVIKEKEKRRYKLSVRTTAPIDGSKICAIFGGGGHARAAGCELHGTLEEVRAQIVTAVANELDSEI